MSTLFMSTDVVKFVLALLKHADAALNKKVGVTYSQFRVLLLLRAHISLSQQELAKLHCSTPAAISRLVETLVKKKFLERSSNPVNRRENVLCLSAQGSQKLTTAVTLIQKMEKDLYGNLTDEKRSIFLETTKLLASLVESA